MNWQKVMVPAAAVAAVYLGWRYYGWGGVAFVVTAGVMWMLMHFNRLLHVMKKAADRPKGYVGSAVMLNAKLKPGVNLLHVIALTQSLGEQLSVTDAQPEVYRWADAGGSSVTCEFAGGKLVKWTLERPVSEDAPGASTGS